MTFEDRQRRTAVDLGYGDDVAAMNADHDPLHHDLCNWLGTISRSLDKGPKTHADACLANYEEEAVLAVQRFKRHLQLKDAAWREG